MTWSEVSECDALDNAAAAFFPLVHQALDIADAATEGPGAAQAVEWRDSGGLWEFERAADRMEAQLASCEVYVREARERVAAAMELLPPPAMDVLETHDASPPPPSGV